MVSHPPVATRGFADHVDQLRSSDGVRFSHEYESIEPGQQFTWDASNLDVNKAKNRYANVIAYDHSRVVLQSLDGVVGSDYINANFMDGYRQQNAYIATQVPSFASNVNCKLQFFTVQTISFIYACIVISSVVCQMS